MSWPVGNTFGKWCKGRHLSEEHKHKLSESNKGKHFCEVGFMKGKHHTEETKRKMSESRKGRHLSEETRRKMSVAQKNAKRAPFTEEHKKKLIEASRNRIWTDEMRKKMSKSKTGTHWGKHTEESKKKMSLAQLGEKNHMWGKSTWLKGKHWSEEMRKKLSEAHKNDIPRIGWHHTDEVRKILSIKHTGKRFSEETRKKMSEARKGSLNIRFGKHLSEEQKRKISLAGKGRHHTEEARKKMSEARKGSKNPRWCGGKSLEPYGSEFNKELKQQILNRDNHMCQLTGKTKKDGIRLVVHHIDYCKKHNYSDNLLTLENNIHLKTNINRDFWQAFFIGKLYEINVGDLI